MHGNESEKLAKLDDFLTTLGYEDIPASSFINVTLARESIEIDFFNKSNGLLSPIYVGISFNSFIQFLRKHEYAKEFIASIVHHQEELGHLSFEVNENHNIRNLSHVPRVAFYGIL